MNKPAYLISELVALGPLGRSKIFTEIRAGRLPARKAGNKTVVMADDYEAYLNSLPPVEPRPATTKNRT
jgi:hypothetical protein